MTRIPGHTIADAPGAARPLLEGVVPFSPTGKLLNLHGWSSEQLAEAFACLALTVFTTCFLNYAQTPADLPVGPAAAAGRE